MPNSFFRKILASFMVFVFLVLTFPQTAQSSAQFATGYNISFTFSDSGKAKVTQKISLTNLTDNFYASEYSLTISSDRVSSVKGSDGSGSIRITTKTQNSSTILVASLNEKVVGKNKKVNFQISYEIDSLAVKRGRIWEINIPQIVTSENVSSYKLTVSTPKSFGKVGKMSPNPDQTTTSGNFTNFVFGKGKLTSSGIGASFGDYQLFKFTLKYRYKNSNLYTAQATIALPPDTEYQAINYTSIDPRPAKMRVDESGNYLATYTVKGGKILEVIAQGYAKMVDAETPFQIPKTWSQEELEEFTKSDKYIESQHHQIQKKATELKDIKEIYDYVSTTLKYDYSRLENDTIGRRGALSAFNNPEQSICTDFSDLFVALARAKGIPARGLIGFAYTDNTDLRPTKIEGLVDTTVLHAWPEYYDQEQKHWVQVDPTWASTTGGIDYFNRLDTNHFVFAIYGTSSELPYPAGAYKLSENEIDDVKVEVVDDEIDIDPDPALSLDVDKIISGFPTVAKLTVENKTGRALFNSKITVTGSKDLGLVSQEVIELGTLLPFQKVDSNIRLRSSSLFTNKNDTLEVELVGTNQDQELKKSLEKPIAIKPFFSFELPQIALLIIFLIVFASWIQPQLPRFKSAFQRQ